MRLENFHDRLMHRVGLVFSYRDDGSAMFYYDGFEYDGVKYTDMEIDRGRENGRRLAFIRLTDEEAAAMMTGLAGDHEQAVRRVAAVIRELGITSEELEAEQR